jgi:hypothetical protein
MRLATILILIACQVAAIVGLVYLYLSIFNLI